MTWYRLKDTPLPSIGEWKVLCSHKDEPQPIPCIVVLGELLTYGERIPVELHRVESWAHWPPKPSWDCGV